MAEKRFKRKNYLVDKGFQFRFIASFLLLIAISFLVLTSGFVVYYWVRYVAGENVFSEFIFIQRQIRVTGESGESTQTKSEMLPPINRLELILPPVLINNLIIMFIISVVGIFYSHRIAGPVYRMEQDLARVLSGEKGVKIRLRKRDKMQSLAQKINQLIEQNQNSA